MTDRELMQKALEALEEIADEVFSFYDNKLGAAILALRERLAQPEQKPVAWGVFDGPNLHDVNFTEEDAQEMVRLKGDGSVVKPLYTSTPERKPLTDEELKPLIVEAMKHYGLAPVSYPKNKPLTEGKFKKVAAGLFDLARAVEAKHGVTP